MTWLAGLTTESRWLDNPVLHEQLPEATLDTLAMTGVSGLLTAVRSGFGIAVLPCIVADADPDLIRCIPPRPDHGRIMWLLTHERLRHTPRVRIVMDFLAERLVGLVRQAEQAHDLAPHQIRIG